MSDNAIPAADTRCIENNPDLQTVVANPRLREAVWIAMRAKGYTDDQIAITERSKGTHAGCGTETLLGFSCADAKGTPNHPMLDEYLSIEEELWGTGLIPPIPAGSLYPGMVATDEDVLNAVPAGTLIRCVKDKADPNWPDVFLHTGGKHDPWLHLNLYGRSDGEANSSSGAVLRWHGDGQAIILHIGTVR